MDNIIKGLQILNKYDFMLYAEHDIIYAGEKEDVSEEDVQALDKLGWFYSEEYESWAHFV